MKTFYTWINENTVDYQKPFGTIIGDLVRKFLVNFKPLKENQGRVKSIYENIYKLYEYPHLIKDLIPKGDGEYSSEQLIITLKLIIVGFQDIAMLNKNSPREEYGILFHTLYRGRDFPYPTSEVGNLMFLIQKIIDQIIVLYHQELLLSNKDSIETALENIVYDFDLPKDFIEMIRDGLNSFEFKSSPDLYYLNFHEAFFNFEALNTGNVSLQGVQDTLEDFLYLLKKIAEGTILTNTIRGMLHQLSYKDG